MLAGVAATGEEEVFSIMSAGIFLFFVANIPRVQRNYGPRIATQKNEQKNKRWKESKRSELHLCQLAAISPLSV